MQINLGRIDMRTSEAMKMVVGTVQGPRFFPTCKLTSQPARVSRVLAEDMTFLGQIQHCRQRELRVHIGSVCPPWSHSGDVDASCVLHTRWVSMLWLRNPELREPQDFIMGCQQSCVTLIPEKHIISIYTEQQTNLRSASEGDAISVF